jgi:hypothetical protein
MLNEDGSSVEHTTAGDSNNAQSGTVGQKKKQKRETDAAVATSSETESTDTFQYDSLFKFSSRKMNVDSGGNNVKEARDQERRMSSSAAGEASGTANRTRKGATLKCENNDMKTKQKKANLSSPEHKEPTSCHRKTADSFRDERLFTCSGKTDKVHSGGVDLNDEMDANPAVHNSKKKGAVYHPTDKQFTTNRDTAKGTKEKDFFRYDRLFNFRTRKQNATPDTDNQAGTNKTKDKDFFKYDKLFSFSTQKQNAPENADKAATNWTEEKDFFRYDKLFDFSTKKQNAPDYAENKATTNKTEEKDFSRSDKHFSFNTQKQNAPENADNKATTNKTEEKDFFRYDKLFNFSTQTQNAPENADNKATTNKAEEKDFFRSDKHFSFNTQKQNAPENADNKATTNEAEEKDFFRCDRLFSFSTGKQNPPDSTDDTSISSDDWYQYELVDESETLDDDYTHSHMFSGGMLFILISLQSYVL